MNVFADINTMVSICQALLLIMILHKASGQCSSSDRRAIETLTVEEEPSYLTSPGWKTAYYSNMDCRWTLQSPAGTVVIVDVMESYFEGSPGCSYDYLGIYDGNSISATATRLCNNMRFGRLFVASSNAVLLRLKSDFSVNYAGFSLRYYYASSSADSSCAQFTSLTASSNLQYIMSPGFPAPFDSTQTCEWQISSSSTSINVFVLQTDLLSGEICYSDKLQLYEGPDATGTKLAELCDSSDTFIDTLQYSTNRTTTAFIKFDSLESGRTRKGFLIAYNESTTVLTVPTTTPSSTYSTCGEQVISITDTSIPVYITSPDYPVFYSNNLNCYWQVSGPQGSVLQLKIIDFFLEDSESCFGDSVTINDGLNSGFPQLFLDCGETGTTEVNSTGNSAYISFRSDGSTSSRGFKIQVVVLGGGTPVCVEGSPTELNATFDRQYFQSPNYPNNYDSSSTSKWLIHNSESYDYEIVIETVDSRLESSVNCYADKVQLYKGPCSSYPSLGAFCGQDTPTYTQSSGLYVLVTFTSDSTVTYKGFNISYYLQKAKPSGLSTVEILAIILGVVFGCIALVVISVLLYKFVIVKKLKRIGSLTSIHSRSSSSSSSSSDDDEKPAPKKHKKLRPLTANVGRVSLMSKKPQLPPIKSSKR